MSTACECKERYIPETLCKKVFIEACAVLLVDKIEDLLKAQKYSITVGAFPQPKSVTVQLDKHEVPINIFGTNKEVYLIEIINKQMKGVGFEKIDYFINSSTGSLFFELQF